MSVVGLEARRRVTVSGGQAAGPAGGAGGASIPYALCGQRASGTCTDRSSQSLFPLAPLLYPAVPFACKVRQVASGGRSGSRGRPHAVSRVPVELPVFRLQQMRDHDGDVVVVEGELDVWTAPRLRTALRALDSQRVTVDLSGVSVLCAAGMHVLAAHEQQVQAREGRLRVRGARPLAARCLRLTGLGHLLADPRW